jgi:hypothetical protein
MRFSPADINTMRQALVDLSAQIEETGPCDHPVNICVCGLRTTYENLSDLFYRISDRQVGFARKPELVDMLDLAHKALLSANLQRIAQIKAEAEAANAAFRKGTIND